MRSARTVATFRRRSTRERPRCGRAWRRVNSGSSGRSQRAASSRARASAGWCAAFERALRIGRHRDECRGAWRRLERPADDRSGSRGETAERPVLPSGDDRAGRLVVDDGRARGGEGEPPAGALRAAAHRPGRRSAAAGADWRPDPAQASKARLARGRPRPAADDTDAAGTGAPAPSDATVAGCDGTVPLRRPRA